MKEQVQMADQQCILPKISRFAATSKCLDLTLFSVGYPCMLSKYCNFQCRYMYSVFNFQKCKQCLKSHKLDEPGRKKEEELKKQAEGFEGRCNCAMCYKRKTIIWWSRLDGSNTDYNADNNCPDTALTRM